MEDMPGSRTGPEKLGRPGLSGGLGKRGHGGNGNPPCNRKGEAGNPPPTTGAPEFYPNPFEVVLDTILARVTLVPGKGARSTWRS